MLAPGVLVLGVPEPALDVPAPPPLDPLLPLDCPAAGCIDGGETLPELSDVEPFDVPPELLSLDAGVYPTATAGAVSLGFVLVCLLTDRWMPAGRA